MVAASKANFLSWEVRTLWRWEKCAEVRVRWLPISSITETVTILGEIAKLLMMVHKEGKAIAAPPLAPPGEALPKGCSLSLQRLSEPWGKSPSCRNVALEAPRL